MGLRDSISGAWGILGGTFDPIHYAHLAVAEQAREALSLAGVLFVPAGVPPHKQGLSMSPATAREAMVALAIADNPTFRLSRVEIDRPGPSYSVDTVELLLREDLAAEGRQYVFILSVEALAGLQSWHEPRRLLELSLVAVVPRLGHPLPDRGWLARHFPGQEDRVLFLDGPHLGHSASDIRRRASEGRTIRYLVPPTVEAYIRDHGLYRQ
ncbi:MAG: nicotinate-nucleotide adenylyltransferase [Chloroflexota bacterium]|nr:nicotinate-nucleotide adenylyltransferase [Chloroflexota bacterium]